MKNYFNLTLGIFIIFATVLFGCNNGNTISNEYFSISFPSGWKEINESQFEEVAKQMEKYPGIKFTGINFFDKKMLNTDIIPDKKFYFYNTANPFHVLRVDIYEGTMPVKDIAPYVKRVEDYDGTQKEFRKINGKEFFLNGTINADKSYYDCEICAVVTTDEYIYSFHIDTAGKGVETGPKIIKSIKIKK